MRAHGVEVERPVIPTAIELSTSEEELKDPNARPVKVGSAWRDYISDYVLNFASCQVTLQYLEPQACGDETEVVHAKFVLGADGE